MHSFYILYIKVYINCKCIHLFSTHPFHFVHNSLFCEKASQFDIASFIYFQLCFPCLRTHIQKKAIETNIKEQSAYVCSRSFMVSGLAFKSLIQFEVIFVCCMRNYFRFFFPLHLPVQFSQHLLLRVHFFIIAFSCLFCNRLIVFISTASFLDSILFHQFTCLLFASTILL